jgi:toxin ParE1/3/4
MHIRWTEPAARDLTQICDYIQEHGNAKTARRVALSIHERIAALSDFPELGRMGRRPGTRELTLSGLPCVAIYRVRQNTIQILRILHGAQRWP